MKTSKFQ